MRPSSTSSNRAGLWLRDKACALPSCLSLCSFAASALVQLAQHSTAHHSWLVFCNVQHSDIQVNFYNSVILTCELSTQTGCSPPPFGPTGGPKRLRSPAVLPRLSHTSSSPPQKVLSHRCTAYTTHPPPHHRILLPWCWLMQPLPSPGP